VHKHSKLSSPLRRRQLPQPRRNLQPLLQRPRHSPLSPEITLTAARPTGRALANALSSAGLGYSLKINARLVDVGIVVYDKKGHPVKDLKPEDFELSE